MNEVNATPHAELIAELMNPNNPKNEREHAAVWEIERLREALAQTQEPVAWISTGTARMIHWTADKPAYGDDWVPLYTAPPQRTWVGLTPEDTFEIGERLGLSDIAWVDLMQAIEAKLKDKNTRGQE